MNQQYLIIGQSYGLTHNNLNPDRCRKHNVSSRYDDLTNHDFKKVLRIHLALPLAKIVTLHDRINYRGGLRMEYKKDFSTS